VLIDALQNARVAAMEDDEVDLYADPDKGQQAYFPKEEQEVTLPSNCACAREWSLC
jgi:hypothetical protein